MGNSGLLRKVSSLIICISLLFQQAGLAQTTVKMDLSGYLSGLKNSFTQDVFRPAHLRYFSYDNLSDTYKLLLEKGDFVEADLSVRPFNGTAQRPSPTDTIIKQEAKKLLEYFLVGVSLLDDMFWVNLRPDSENQVIDSWLEKTDVGRIMLEADLQLKKDTAAFTSPQTKEGREYWNKLYKKAEELYGYETVDIPTLTRPWIVPGEIIVRETNDSAYVYKATLKVMLEEDYLRRGGSPCPPESKGTAPRPSPTDNVNYEFKDPRAKELNKYSTQLIRKLIIPKLTKEINSGKRYAALRQVYYSLILSRWFKMRFSGKSGTYASLINTRNLKNLTSQQAWSKTAYFRQYQKSFTEGEYNIKEPVRTPTGQVIRSYFSGGVDATPKNMGINVFSGRGPMSSAILNQPGVIPIFGDAKQILSLQLTEVSSSGITMPDLSNMSLPDGIQLAVDAEDVSPLENSASGTEKTATELRRAGVKKILVLGNEPQVEERISQAQKAGLEICRYNPDDNRYHFGEQAIDNLFSAQGYSELSSFLIKVQKDSSLYHNYLLVVPATLVYTVYHLSSDYGLNWVHTTSAEDSSSSGIQSEAEFAQEVAKLTGSQGISAGKGTSFILDSIKAPEFIKSLARRIGVPENRIVEQLQTIPELSSVLSKYRLSLIDLKKTVAQVDAADRVTLAQPDIAQSASEFQTATGLKISLIQPKNTVVDKKEKAILDQHHAIVREQMAKKDSRHSPDADPEEDFNYRGKVREYYHRIFLPGVARRMEDFVDTHFTNRGKKVKYVVKAGIGANEEYDHAARAVYDLEEREENGIIYVVINNSYEFEMFRQRHSDANGDNTLMIYESRSGETEEPLKVFLFNHREFPVSIVFSNQGPLHETAKAWIAEQRNAGLTPTILLEDFRTGISGRFMRRKTAMSYCALHLLDELLRNPRQRITHSRQVKEIAALMARLKKLNAKTDGEEIQRIEEQIAQLEQELEKRYANRWAYQYMLATDRADKLLAFTREQDSLAVQVPEFIHTNQLLSRRVSGGRDQIALIVNDEAVLWPATEQPIQNWMEGVNKPGNKLIMARYLFDDEPEAIASVLAQADSHIAFFVLNKKLPNYQEALAKAQEMAAKGMPVIIMEIDGANTANMAAFSTFIEDMVVGYSGFANQPYGTNPEVKYVRENSDGRLVAIADDKRTSLGLPKITTEKKPDKVLTPKEIKSDDPTVVSFAAIFTSVEQKLGLRYAGIMDALLQDALDGELVVNAFAEENGVHRETAIAGINKAGVFPKVVADFNAAMERKARMQAAQPDKSAFIDEDIVKQQAEKLGIENIKFSIGPSDIPVNTEEVIRLQGKFAQARGEDSLAKRIAEFIYLSYLSLLEDNTARTNIVLTTNDQFKIGFAKKFKEQWAKNVASRIKFMPEKEPLPRASHLIIEGRLGQAGSHFEIVVLAESLGLTTDQVLSAEDVKYSNPAHEGLDRNEALLGLAIGNEDTILSRMPGIAIRVKQITPGTDRMLTQLFKEVSEHYAQLLASSAVNAELIQDSKASSSMQTMPEDAGAIDFRGKAMKINFEAMGSFKGLDMKLPQLSSAEAERINVDAEIKQIKQMVSSGIRPSDRHVIEVIAACEQKGKMAVYASDLLLCVAGSFALEEISGDKSSLDSQKALAFLDSRS